MVTTEQQMPGALNEGEKSRTLQMVVFPSWLAVVDEWRRAQPDNPNRSEAIRRMVLIAAGRKPDKSIEMARQEAERLANDETAGIAPDGSASTTVIGP